jgi:hypothetical protein
VFCVQKLLLHTLQTDLWRDFHMHCALEYEIFPLIANKTCMWNQFTKKLPFHFDFHCPRYFSLREEITWTPCLLKLVGKYRPARTNGGKCIQVTIATNLHSVKPSMSDCHWNCETHWQVHKREKNCQVLNLLQFWSLFWSQIPQSPTVLWDQPPY